MSGKADPAPGQGKGKGNSRAKGVSRKGFIFDEIFDKTENSLLNSRSPNTEAHGLDYSSQ